MKNVAAVSAPKPQHPKTSSKAVRIPRQFQGAVINCMGSETSGYGYDFSCRTYGLWTCKVLTEGINFFTDPQKFSVGDLVQLPGNEAVFAAYARHVEFVDERLDDEEKLFAEAARLQVPLPARENPAFAGR